MRSHRLELECLEDRQLLASGVAVPPITDIAHLHTPPAFASDTDLASWLVQQAVAKYDNLFGKTFPAYSVGPVGADQTGVLASASMNIQTPGVDEADLVKTDGQAIYTISRNHFNIVQVGSQPQLLAQIALDGTPMALYLDGDRAAIITQSYASPSLSSGIAQPPVFAAPRLELTVFDVHDLSHVQIASQTVLDGRYIDSRMQNGSLVLVTQDGFPGLAPPVYVLTNDNITYESKAQYVSRIAGHELDLALPHTYTPDGDTSELLESATHIHGPISDQAYALTNVLLFNMHADTSGPEDTLGLIGATGAQVYASVNYLYLVNPLFLGDQGEPVVSSIQVIDWHQGTLTLAATGGVLGTVLNQYSLDEYNGYLRVATTQGDGPQSANGVYVLHQDGADLSLVGKVEELAPGKSIQTVRFLGSHAYVVTFAQTDPMFAVDLSDPANPKVVGEVTGPGFTSYLQPIDETHLLAIVQASDAYGIYDKIRLYDVTDYANPVELSDWLLPETNYGPGGVPFSTPTYERLGSPWTENQNFIEAARESSGSLIPETEAAWEHHAVTYYPESHLLTLPTVYTSDDAWGIQHESPILDVLRVDPQQGIKYVARVWNDSSVRKGLAIGDQLYAVSDDAIKSVSLSDPSSYLLQTEIQVYDDPRDAVTASWYAQSHEALDGAVLYFTAANVSDLHAAIDWGDGTTSEGHLARAPQLNEYKVGGDHTYAGQGDYPLTISFTRGDQAVNAFASSVHVEDLSTANAIFVSRLYQCLLSRQPDDAGSAFWQDLLNKGVSRGDVALGFQNSNEYRVNEIHQLYWKYLFRGPDSDGLLTWLGVLRAGNSIAVVEANIVGSQEFFQNQHNDPTAFVQSLYRYLLGRDGEGIGNNFWSQALSSGATRTQVVLGFLNSTEVAGRVVNDMYQKVLNRWVDDDGLGYFVHLLQHGLPRENAIAQIAGSDEYFVRHW